MKAATGAHSLAKPQAWSLQPYQKEPPHRHTQALSYFITFENSKNTHFPEHLLMAASVVNTVGKKISLVKKNKWLIKTTSWFKTFDNKFNNFFV